MRRKHTVAIIAVLIVGFIIPTGARADERCTPIAHLVDAGMIPGNEGPNPDSDNPDHKYEDGAGLNCIPTYELDFAGALADENVPKGKCAPESVYDTSAIEIAKDAEFYKRCKRLKFTMGPLLARPGMNDTMVHVTTIEHPMYDGYSLRWKPGLQSADGSVPPVEDLHLHHGTWIGGVNGPTAATGPFFATGEEQTILQYPKGYGWNWQGESAWSMIYMLHNALADAKPVYITYDIDYISTEDAAEIGGIKDTKSIWMDVGAGTPMTSGSGSSNTQVAPYSSLNPIFNAQRGYGHADDGAFSGLNTQPGSPLQTVPVRNNNGTGKQVCSWPRENCAGFNSKGSISGQQGIPKLNVVGKKVAIQNALSTEICPEVGKRCGVLVNMGGHLHPGGLRDEVSILRGDKIIPIHISDAVYWGGSDYSDPVSAGAPPKSWDLSMTGTMGVRAGDGLEKDAWRVLIQEGDSLILNGVYDTEVGSAYDQMGIVMSWAHPGFDPQAVDPFDPNTILDAGWAEGSNFAPRPAGIPAAIDVGCVPGTRTSGADEGKTVLCLRGNVTHGSMPSRQDHADCSIGGTCPALTSQRTALADTTITTQGFSYGQTDLGLAQAVGIPTVPANTKLTFYNPDTAAMIWHTITACPNPCTGATSASYPYPAGAGTQVDFDSAILCAGLGCADAPVTKWEYQPIETGIYTFFCRIHPFMRGAFEVV